MTVEELQAKLEEATEAIEVLSGNNKKLTNELRNERSKNREIDMETYNKTLDENESLKSTLEKVEKTYKGEVERLSKELSAKDGYLQKTILEDGISKALLEAGVDKQYLKASLALIKNDAKVVQGEDGYKAVINDKDLSEFIPAWIESDGKIFTARTPDVGVGGNGGGNGGGATEYKKYFDTNNAEFNLTKQAEIFKTNPELYKQLKG